MSANTERDWVAEIGKPCYECLAEMVAALECDYERLEELRDEREDLASTFKDAQEALAAYGTVAAEDKEGEEEAAALEVDLDRAQTALADWDAIYGDELKELTEEAGEFKDRDEAYERIQEDPLSVEVRSGWVAPGAEMTPEDFCILLGTGGPATRIRGELDEHGEPYRAWLEVQDWGKPWSQYFGAEQDVLLSYARCFVFQC